jgi:acetoacetyl-CoA synthetase
MTKPLWEASPQRTQQANLTHFIAALARATGRSLATFEDLHRFSISEPVEFWAACWDEFRLLGDKGQKPWFVAGQKLQDGHFFPDARINYAENLLRTRSENPALIFWGEDTIKSQVSWDELRLSVGRFQNWLDATGIGPSSRIGAVLPNMPEAIVAMLGGASRGVTWSSCSPDFGQQGILDRLGQIAPEALIVCDGYYYGGKTIGVSAKMSDVLRELPSVKHVLIVSYTGKAGEDAESLKRALAPREITIDTWQHAISARPPKEPTYARLPFSHPLCILFSSGTTGVPKCIVHSAGGLLLKHQTEQILHTDIKPGDRVFYFSTLGWMMWNWLASALAAGATLMLYDGNPLVRDGNILWDYAAQERITHFGTSAKYIDALHKMQLAPKRTHDLTPLKAIMSTGSPLSPESFDYVYASIRDDVHLASISGGTDICGCFVLGNPLKPVWRGEIQSPALGLATDVVDENANSVRLAKGELVCRNAFPSMPIGFLNDADGNRYHAAYFARFPGLWHHGDFAEWTQHGGMIIHGRSDATLNPGGVRIGTAEIYRQVEQLAEIQESIVIGQPWDNDVRVVLFVILKPDYTLTPALIDRIKKHIREGASPRHVPAKIIAVTDIPRTRSGKIAELAVRDVIMKRDVKNKEALANPDALSQFGDLPDLMK